MPNNRELAEVLLLLGILALAALSRSARVAIAGVWTAFWKVRVAGTFALFVLVCATTVWIANRLGLWSPVLFGQAWLWVLWSGWPLLLSLTDVFREDQYVAKRMRETLSSSVVLGAVFSLVSFRLWIELVLVAALTLLRLLVVVAHDEAAKGRSHPLVRRLFQGCLGAITAVVVAVTLWRLALGIEPIDWDGLRKSMAMAVWLPLAALAFVILLGAAAEYGQAFTSMHIANGFHDARMATWLAVLIGFNWHVRELRDFAGGRTRAVTNAGSFRQSLRAVRQFRCERAGNHLS